MIVKLRLLAIKLLSKWDKWLSMKRELLLFALTRYCIVLLDLEWIKNQLNICIWKPAKGEKKEISQMASSKIWIIYFISLWKMSPRIFGTRAQKKSSCKIKCLTKEFPIHGLCEEEKLEFWKFSRCASSFFNVVEAAKFPFLSCIAILFIV